MILYKLREKPDDGYDYGSELWRIVVDDDSGEREDTLVFSDGIEPEDASLSRDLGVFVDELRWLLGYLT